MSQSVNEIKIRIHEESDLYDSLDPEQQYLSDDVISYIENRYSEKAEYGRISIHIISDKPVNTDRVKEAFRKYAENETNALDKEKHMASIRQIRLFLIGVLFISVWLIASARIENVGVEVLSVIGSFAVWEAADIWIVGKPEIRWKKRRLQRLQETKICITINTAAR